MEHVNNKVSQKNSQHKCVVSWLKSWKVHVAEKTKGSNLIPYMPRGICEDCVQL